MSGGAPTEAAGANRSWIRIFVDPCGFDGVDDRRRRAKCVQANAEVETVGNAADIVSEREPPPMLGDRRVADVVARQDHSASTIVAARALAARTIEQERPMSLATGSRARELRV